MKHPHTAEFLGEMVMKYKTEADGCNYPAAQRTLRELADMANMLADSYDGLPGSKNNS